MYLDEVLGLWVQCFQRNAAYVKYCGAKQVADEASCKALEAKFDRIADLYQDWGDIRGMPSETGSETLWAFIEEKGALFFELERAKTIDNIEDYTFKAGHLLLEVPLSEEKTPTLERLKLEIDRVYAQRRRHIKCSENYRLMLQPLRGPKYTPHNDLDVSDISRLKRAVYVGQQKHIHANGKPYTAAEAVIAIMQDKKNPLGWSISAKDLADHKSGAYKKVIAKQSEETLLRRYRKDYAALVKNTIYGRFPDYS